MPSAVVRDATLAHMLAVVEAFGTDRLEDEQVECRPPGVAGACWAELRRERDRAMVRPLRRPRLPADADFVAPPTRVTTGAIQRRAGDAAAPAPAGRHRVATRERRSASSASGCRPVVALARAAGWDARRCRAVRATLDAVCARPPAPRRRRRLGGRSRAAAGRGPSACSRASVARASAGDRAADGTSIRLKCSDSGVLGAHARTRRAASHAARAPSRRAPRRARASRRGRRARGRRWRRSRRARPRAPATPSAPTRCRPGPETSWRDGPARRLGLRLRAASPSGQRRRRLARADVVVATAVAVEPASSTPRCTAWRGRAWRPLLAARRSSGPASPRGRRARAARRRACSRDRRSPVRYVALRRRGRACALPPRLDARRRARLSAPSALVHAAAPPPGRRRRRKAVGGFSGRAAACAVDRDLCGDGAGTRLAVIDDDARGRRAARARRRRARRRRAHAAAASAHAALMVGWAVGACAPTARASSASRPDASPRLYCIPKPGTDARLAAAGHRARGARRRRRRRLRDLRRGDRPARCSTTRSTSRAPRAGAAAAPSSSCPPGREASSPADSVHASLSLGLGEPGERPARASASRPAARGGGWFLWRDRRGRLRPFANRGPAVRWLAPGDDIAYPFSDDARAALPRRVERRRGHRGRVVLLVLGLQSRACGCTSLHALLARTATPRRTPRCEEAALADPADVLPAGRDPDGHDAKCGYGRLDAARACAGGA